MFSITLFNPDNTPLTPPPVTWTVERLSWRAVGGPWAARLRADSPRLNTLWQIGEALGCGLTVSDARGPAWWGYFSALELHAGGQVLRRSLDEMANQVAVTYHERTPDERGGPRRQTGWVVDAPSIARFGEKQQLFDLGPSGADAAAASHYAATLLRQSAQPQIVARVEEQPAQAAPYLLVEARGWWERLDWRFYSEPRGLEGHQSSGSVTLGVGSGSASVMLAQSFRLGSPGGWTADEVWLRLRRNHAADDLTLELRAGDASAPGATVLSRAHLPIQSAPDELGWARFALDPPLALQPGVDYWLVLSRSGALDPDACVLVAADENAAYPRGSLRLLGPGGWSARVPDADAQFQVLGTEETSAQLAHLLSEAPCIGGVRLECASGISSRVYRDGSLRARAEAEALLRGGAADGTRLLASITPGRAARIYAQPRPSESGLALGPGGQILRLDGRALSPSESPAGQWARLGALTPPGAPADEPYSYLFIERCAWDGRRLTLSMD